jgi:hypothetical protein
MEENQETTFSKQPSQYTDSMHQVEEGSFVPESQHQHGQGLTQAQHVQQLKGGPASRIFPADCNA